MRTCAEWQKRLLAAEVPHAPVLDYAQLFTLEQVAARGMKVTVHDVAGKPVELAGTPFHVAGATLGCIGLTAFAVVCWLSLPRLSTALVFALATLAWAALCHMLRVQDGWAEELETSRRKAIDRAREALEAGESDPGSSLTPPSCWPDWARISVR